MWRSTGRKIKDVKTDELHGRGIIVAKSIGGKLSYNTKGSTALLTLPNESRHLQVRPQGFLRRRGPFAEKRGYYFPAR
jgi:hypothetical protein